MALFSVLIASYNNGKFLHDAIQSVLRQSYTEWEIIIVDDASDDNSVEIIQDYMARGYPVKLYLHASNEGCGSTKRDCAEHACGGLCGFLDPDDALTDDALEVMVRQHQLCPEASLVYSRFWFCDQGLKVTRSAKWVKPVPEGEINLLHDMVMHFVAFKKRAYDRTEGIGRQYRSAVDKDLYYKLEEVGPVRFVDRELYYYRENPGGMSQFHNYYEAQENHFRVIEKAMQRRQKSGFPSLTQRQYHFVRSRILLQRAEQLVKLRYPPAEVFYWLKESFKESPLSYNHMRIKYLIDSWTYRPKSHLVSVW